jgi:Domain of unknown function (DUF4386)
VVGLLFIITFVVSIPAALVLYTPVLDHTDYILGAGADNRVALGAFLEMILIVANIGTAVVLFPILRRQNEALSLGYVTARVMESVFIAVGLLTLLAIVTLRQDLAGRRAPTRPRSTRSADRSSRSMTGRSCSGQAGSSASETGCCSATSCTDPASSHAAWRCWG